MAGVLATLIEVVIEHHMIHSIPAAGKLEQHVHSAEKALDMNPDLTQLFVSAGSHLSCWHPLDELASETRSICIWAFVSFVPKNCKGFKVSIVLNCGPLRQDKGCTLGSSS